MNAVVLAVESINSSVSKARIIDEGLNVVHDHDYVHTLSHSVLSSCSEKFVACIAGFVAFKLKTSIRCETCTALTDALFSPIHSLMKLKCQSPFTIPTHDVADICNTCETFFWRYVDFGHHLSHISATSWFNQF